MSKGERKERKIEKGRRRWKKNEEVGESNDMGRKSRRANGTTGRFLWYHAEM